MKLSIKDFFSKCDQIHKKLRIWSHLLKKSLIENFILCAMKLASAALLQSLFVMVIFQDIFQEYDKIRFQYNKDPRGVASQAYK